MLPDDLITFVNDTVSGIRARDYVNALSEFHRIQASPGIHDATVYLKQEIKKVSDAKVKIFSYSADGASPIETWDTPYGWFPKSGTLELLEPEQRTLAEFDAEPISLVAHSRSTDMEADVVFVGKGLSSEDYKGKDVKGKIVLTEGLARMVHRVACIDEMAAGVLTYVAPSGIDEIASLRRYDAIWPSSEEGEKVKFGFSLTQADGVQIKKWLEEGKKVRVKAKVQAKLKKGTLEVISALIEGKDTSREFWLFAHVCHPHPGANDNASGSAALLEALRSLALLLRKGVIEKPDISIRFLWGPEWSGTIKFIHHETNLLKRCQAMLNMDMVGADPSKSGSIFHMYRTPFSLPSTFNNVVRHWLCEESSRERRRAAGGTLTPLPWSYSKFAAGSDHYMFVDATVGIPSVMLNQSPDKFYHTSTDTSDKIDPAQMAYATRVAVLTALTYLYSGHTVEEAILAEVRNEAIDIMQAVGTQGITELATCKGDPDKVYPRVLRWLGMALDLGKATLNKAATEWALISEQDRLREALKTSLDMAYTSEMMIARKAYEGACAEVGLEAKEEHEIELDTVGLDVEVKRNFKYPLSPSMMAEKLKDKMDKYMKLKEKDHHLYVRIDEMLNLSIDWANLNEIWDKLCFQFGHSDSQILVSIVDDLKEMGVLEVREV